MKRNFRFAFFILAFAGLSLESPQWAAAKSHVFVSPQAGLVNSIPYPITSAGNGLVTLAVNLDATGAIQNIQTLRDIASMTQPATTAVNGWTFAPGTLDGASVPSSLVVEVLFVPSNLNTLNLSVPPANSSPPLNPPGFVPANISTASFPSYPVTSVAMGTVIFDVLIGSSGQIKNVRVLKDVPSLTAPAQQNLHSWTFTPASYQGNPIPSRLIVAFVFQGPLVTRR
jgi:hypothetical protein